MERKEQVETKRNSNICLTKKVLLVYLELIYIHTDIYEHNIVHVQEWDAHIVHEPIAIKIWQYIQRYIACLHSNRVGWEEKNHKKLLRRKTKR